MGTAARARRFDRSVVTSSGGQTHSPTTSASAEPPQCGNDRAKAAFDARANLEGLPEAGKPTMAPITQTRLNILV